MNDFKMQTAKYKLDGKHGLVLKSQKEQVVENSIKIIITDADNGEEEDIMFDEIVKLKNRTGITNTEITSIVGTVRGVKNRVKNRIQLFLSENPDNSDSIPTKSESKLTNLECSDEFTAKNKKVGKVIIYVTSLGIVRKTKSDCLFIRRSFRNLMLKTEEKDIVVQKYKMEFDEVCKGLLPPQVVIDGKVIGGAGEIDGLIETGEIYELTTNIEKISYNEKPCINCAGHSYTNCPKCLGTGHSRVTRMGLSRELNYLKCTMCDEGLIRCLDCLDSIN